MFALRSPKLGIAEIGQWLSARKQVLVSALLFQAAWPVAILANELIVIVYFAFFVAIHYFFVSSSKLLWLFSARVAVLGIFMDAMLFRSGVIVGVSLYPPIWLILLWCMFSLTLPFAFGFLKGRYGLAAFLGATGGSMSYISGSLLRSDVSLMSPFIASVVIIAVAWAIFLPLMYYRLSKAESH